MDAATELAARREGDEAEGVHRLRDIVVEEVSLVDRAANKRRFLVVKRSDDMADDESATAADEDVEKAKKKPAASDADEVDEAKRKKPTDKDELEDAEKAARSSEKDDDEEDAEKAAASDDEDDEDDEEDDAGESKKKRRKTSPPPLSKAAKSALLSGLTDGLERLMAIAKQVQEAPEASADGVVPAGLTADISAVSARLSGLVETNPSGTKKAEVAKGARMAKERLDRFQKALSLLADILKELTESKEAPAGPSAGAAESGVKKRDGEVAPPAVPGLAELVSGISELTRVVKRQEEELSRIRQARGVSNAIPVDGGGRKAEPQDVSWPLDMNRPISRDKVKKETSFFDE